MIDVPTIRGVTIVDDQFASNFCDMGVATIIADVNENSLPEEYPAWGLEDVRNRKAILSLRTIIDFAKSDARFNHDKVGILGASLGGIVTAFIAGLEADRLAAIVTVVGGGNIPYILANSDNDTVEELRDARMESAGLETVEEYENKLRETLRYDPMYFAFRGRSDKMLMVVSSTDTKVPADVQYELHKAFNKPVMSEYTMGHLGTILGVAYVWFDTVSEFLQTKLDIQKLRRPFTPIPIPAKAKQQLSCLADK